MKPSHYYNFIWVLFVLTQFGFSCSSSDGASEETPPEPVVKSLIADASEITFQSEESSYNLNVTTNVDLWVISSSGTSWIELSQTSGTAGTTTVTITALKNASITGRSTTITINANGVSAIKIPVSQAGVPSSNGIYPDYNTNPIAPDPTGMGSTAVQIAAQITLGWNLGNSLEAIGGETAWGNPVVTKALIDLVKQSGFNAVRIPCSWDAHSNGETAEINATWLNRVKEVVQYCTDNNMYAILNIHWDGGWLENNVTEAQQIANNAKQKAFWEQIATQLRDFDEHLLFASANEPNVEDATQMAVLKSYHQTFIDVVRATGGKNAYRTLVIQGPSTDIEKTNNLMTSLPTDTVEDKMMVEIHYYTPWQFCGLEEDASWGKMFYYWGHDYHSASDTTRNATWGEEEDLDNFFLLMKNQFIDQGIPVVLGEFSATRRLTLTGDNLTLHLASRAYYHKYVVQQAKANGLLPFYWDNGGIGDKASGIFNRDNNTVADQQVLDALIEGLN